MQLVPQEIVDWITGVFLACNNRASASLTRQPYIGEEALDSAIIEELGKEQVKGFPGEWSVQVSVKSFMKRMFLMSDLLLDSEREFFIERGRTRTEIADIQLLIMFNSGGKLVRCKSALLQSKKLYCKGDHPAFSADDTLAQIGEADMQDAGELIHDVFLAATEYEFDEDCQYDEIRKGSFQYDAISMFENQREEVYYLLYNSTDIPQTVTNNYIELPENERPTVGARVVRSSDIRNVLDLLEENRPSYRHLVDELPAYGYSGESKGGWRLEEFVVDMLQCKIGTRMYDSGLGIKPDPNAFRYQYRVGRTASPKAVIAISITAPESHQWDFEEAP